MGQEDFVSYFSDERSLDEGCPGKEYLGDINHQSRQFLKRADPGADFSLAVPYLGT